MLLRMTEPPAPAPAGPTPRPAAPKVGDVIGHYRIDSVIQQGGMGEVFLVRDTNGPPEAPAVVLKRLPLEDDDDEDGYAGMFRAESAVMSRLRHPNIVSVLDTFETEGELCLALEFVRGRNLLQLQRASAEQQVAIAPGIGTHIMIQVLEGLHHAHTFVLEDGRPLGAVHRDVTPGNILIGFNGVVKVTDFGIAKSAMSSVATRVGVVKGTTRYLSPEQIRAKALSPRSDIFSAAVVLTEVLSGKPLFDRSAVAPTLFAIVNQERPAVADLLPFAAPELASVLERALATDPELRPPSAQAFADELKAAALSEGWTEATAEVATLIQRLFPEASSSPDAVPSTVRASAPRLDLTYLLEVSEPLGGDEADGSIEEELRALVQGMVAGSAPLDASQFGPVTAPSRRDGAPDTETTVYAVTVPAAATAPADETLPPAPGGLPALSSASESPAAGLEMTGVKVAPALADSGMAPGPLPPDLIPPPVAPPPVAPPPVDPPPPPGPASLSAPSLSMPPPLSAPPRAAPPEPPPVANPLSADLTPPALAAPPAPLPAAAPPVSPPSDLTPPLPAPAVLPTDQSAREILDALEHVSSELDAALPPDPASSAPLTVPRVDAPPPAGPRWPRDLLVLLLGLGLGFAGAQLIPLSREGGPAGPTRASVAPSSPVAQSAPAVKPKPTKAREAPRPASGRTEVSSPPPASAPELAAAKLVPPKATKAKRGPSLLTVRRPKGARVYVDKLRLKRRVPVRKVRIKKGRRLVKIVKGRYRRVFEVDFKPGVHLDVTGGRVREVQPKP